MAKLTFKEDLCKGCGLCVRFCPKGVLALAQERINAKGHHPVVSETNIFWMEKKFHNLRHGHTLKNLSENI